MTPPPSATTCTLCPRPVLPERGLCQACYERDLIRTARERWKRANVERLDVRLALVAAVEAAARALVVREDDRGELARLVSGVQREAERAANALFEMGRLHDEALGAALTLWHARGREGQPALRLEELPPEDPR